MRAVNRIGLQQHLADITQRAAIRALDFAHALVSQNSAIMLAT